YIDLSRIGNGAIFEGTKGSIFADFTTRVIVPNNDDGDFTYYKRRGKEELLPLVHGTGQVTQAPANRPPAPPRPPRPERPLPKGMTGMPTTDRAANGFPVIQ